MARYTERLRQALQAFGTRPRAEAMWLADNLSAALRAAEDAGYELTEEEDMLWLHLTARALDE